MLGVWKESSVRWLEGLVGALVKRHANWGCPPGEAPVVVWD